MPRMRFVQQEDDDAEFLEQVRLCIDWVTQVHRPPELFLIKIDNWFGPNWLRFSGKCLGAIAIWKDRLTIPPFVPHRVLWERRFVGPDYHQKSIKNIVHVNTESQLAQLRHVGDVAPNASLIWFSGGSQRNQRGALMAYLLNADSYWSWYTGWQERSGWKIVEAQGITHEAFDDFRSVRS